ncbi:unnamed protein product [Urochloa humidicola]
MAANPDRLSDLPDDLLRRILHFAPAREAASTAMLSRRWRRVWSTPRPPPSSSTPASTTALAAAATTAPPPSSVVAPTSTTAATSIAAPSSTTPWQRSPRPAG